MLNRNPVNWPTQEKTNNGKLRMQYFLLALALLLIAGGVALTALAPVVDFVGLSAPGFGAGQMQMIAIGVAAIFLGAALMLARRRISDEHIKVRLVDAKVWVLKSVDVRIGTAVFLTGFMVAVRYLEVARSVQSNLFYAATVVQSGGPAGFAYFYGFLYGAVAVLTYAIFRLGMDRLIAVTATLILILSPLHLHNLIPSIMRDYIKAPIMLALVLIMGILITRPYKRNRVFVLAAVGGLIVGIGLWFRADLIVVTAPFVLTLLFFLPGSIKEGLRDRFVAVGIFMFIAAWFSFPTLGSPSAGPINALSGFMSPLNTRVGVTDAAYDWGYLFTDEFVMANSYAQVKPLAPKAGFSFSRQAYLPVASNSVRLIVTNFPADMLTRSYSSVLKILDLPFSYGQAPIGISNRFIRLVYAGRAGMLGLLAGSGLILSAVTLLIISARSPRQAIFCFLFLVYFAGYPVLQFQGRHYFHLEFIGLWSLGFIIQGSSLVAGRLRQGQWRSDISWLRIVAFAFGVAALVFVSLAATRAYQVRRVGRIIKSYEQAPAERLPLVKRSVGRGKILATSPNLAKTPKGSLAVEFLAAEFVIKDGRSTVWPTLRYEKKSHIPGRPGFSRALQIDAPERGSRWVFFPAFYYDDPALGGAARFRGIELSRAEAGTLKALKRLKNPSGLPMLLTMTTPPSGGRNALIQRIIGRETGGLYASPANLPKQTVNTLLKEPFRPIMRRDLAFKSGVVRLNRRGLTLAGYARPQRDPYNRPALSRGRSRLANLIFADVSIGVIDTDLLLTKPIRLKKGGYFIARGVCFVGGVTFGLVGHGQTAGYAGVTNPGPFTVVIKIPDTGWYRLGLANNLDGYTSLENRFILSKFGWINPLERP